MLFYNLLFYYIVPFMILFSLVKDIIVLIFVVFKLNHPVIDTIVSYSIVVFNQMSLFTCCCRVEKNLSFVKLLSFPKFEPHYIPILPSSC